MSRSAVRTSLHSWVGIALATLLGPGACERSATRDASPDAAAAASEPSARTDATTKAGPDAKIVAPPTLAALEAEPEVKTAGRQLMNAPLGMHRLDTHKPTPHTLVVGVHGHESKGYEWVYPLTAMGKTGTQVWWYRWDYDQCPEPMAARLDEQLGALLKAQPDVERVQVIAHSYGGVISMLLAARYDGTPPLTVDVVASPLAGVGILGDRCSYEGPRQPATNVTLRQWRTQHQLDGAFRAMPIDPQVVELPGQVTRLPDTYKDHRLGHNWSISWVVDHLVGAPLAN